MRWKSWDFHLQASRLLLLTGEFCQGILDSWFRESGVDDFGPEQRRAHVLLCRAGELFSCSWKKLSTGKQDGGCGPALTAFSAQLDRDPTLPAFSSRTIETVIPEGFNCYALYPEGYWVAATRLLPRLRKPSLVIGLRSIGTALAGVVAAALGSRDVAITLRPSGHPFARKIRLSPSLSKMLRERGTSREFVIIDEGPGLSGSSFGAVADWLEDEAGVAAENIHFIGSNPGPLGYAACERHRLRWKKADILIADPSPVLELILERIARRHQGILNTAREFRAGEWRKELGAEWAPAHPTQERRKLVMNRHGERGPLLVRFLGLSSHAPQQLATAHEQSRAGWIPRVQGDEYGFLVQDWLEEARPMTAEGSDREALIPRASAYLAFRIAHAAPAESLRITNPSQLYEIAGLNVSEALGPELAHKFERWKIVLPYLDEIWKPRFTDNRWQTWEWLRTESGEILKTDTLDHALNHDCIGPQDPSWDIAALLTELHLSDGERGALISHLGEVSGYRPRSHAVEFSQECYLAFQMASYAMAAKASPERSRLEGVSGRYERLLRNHLVRNPPSIEIPNPQS